MIKVTFYENKEHQIMKFKFSGHAGYANAGEDIVCSAVSILFTNTVNAIEALTPDAKNIQFSGRSKLGNSYTLRFLSPPSSESQLLISALMLGLDSIVTEYGSQYLNITLKEV